MGERGDKEGGGVGKKPPKNFPQEIINKKIFLRILMYKKKSCVSY